MKGEHPSGFCRDSLPRNPRPFPKGSGFQIDGLGKKAQKPSVGEWRSLVAHLVWEPFPCFAIRQHRQLLSGLRGWHVGNSSGYFVKRSAFGVRIVVHIAPGRADVRVAKDVLHDADIDACCHEIRRAEVA